MKHYSYKLVIAGLVSSSMLASAPSEARRQLIPDLPSVEVNLEVLQSLKGSVIAYGDPTYVPFAPAPVAVKPVPAPASALPKRGPQGYVATYETPPPAPMVASKPKSVANVAPPAKIETPKVAPPPPPPPPVKQAVVIPPPPPASPVPKDEPKLAALPEPDTDTMEIMPFPDLPKIEDPIAEALPVVQETEKVPEKIEVPELPKLEEKKAAPKQETARDVLDTLMDMPPREEPLPSEILAGDVPVPPIEDTPDIPELPPVVEPAPSSIDPDIMAMLDKASDEQESLPPLDLPDMPKAEPVPEKQEAAIPMPELPPVTEPAPRAEPPKVIEEPPVLDALPPLPDVPPAATVAAIPPLPDMPDAPALDVIPELPPIPATTTDVPTAKIIAENAAPPAANPQELGTNEIALPDLPPLPEPDVPPLPAVAPPSLPPLDSLTSGAATIAGATPPPSLPDLPPLDAVTSEQPREMEMAALPKEQDIPKAAPTTAKADLMVSFTGTGREVTEADKQKIADIANKAQQSGRRIRVVGYAGAPSSQASMARKTALARALAVRSLLISNQIPQMNITAQSQHLETGAPNSERVDIILQ